MAADAVYWAARPTAEMVPEAFKRIDKWYEFLQTSGKLDLWRRSLNEYYAGARTGGAIGTAGQQDELTTIKVNHCHNLGEHVVTAISGQPPSFLPQAQSNDHESTSQTVIASAILESATSQKGLDEVFTSTTRRAWVLTEGWTSLEWDENGGEGYARDPATGRAVNRGDWKARMFTPDCVVRDYTKETAAEHEWYITRRFENRYNVIARAVAKAQDEETAKRWTDSILAIPSKVADTTRPRLLEFNQSVDESDDIPVWEMRHKKTDACPDGVRCVFVTPEVWLVEGALPFRDVFVFPMRPEDEIGSESGYSPALDLLAPQQAINAAYSSMLSGLSALGHSVLWTKPGNNTTVEELKPFTLIKSQEKVEAINLLPPDALKPHAEFADKMTAQTEILSGVNAVRRGNLDATGKLSGAAYALIDAKFLESVVGLQRAFKSFASAVATAIVQLYQDFAKVEQTVKIAGKANRVYAKEFTGDTIKKVLRVDIEMADPLSRTASGRLQLAEMLLKVVDPVTGKQMIKTPEQLIEVVKTGRLEPLTQGQSKELDNIRAENEMLGDGQKPEVFIFDNHPLHIQEHYSVVASPEARAPGAPVTAVTLAHIADHLSNWQQAPMDGLAARGIQPPPPPAPMASLAPQMPPGPTSGTPPPGPGGPPSSSGPEAPAPEGAGPQPNMPSMPKNPETGESASPPRAA